MTNMKRPRGGMTWDEYETWLRETGQYEDMVERHRKFHEEHQARVEAQRVALIPVVEELQAAGCSLSPSGHLINQPNVQRAIPILLAHLQKAYPHDARVLIARALAVPEMKAHWNELTQLYRNEQDQSVKEAHAATIATIAKGEVVGDVIELVRDKTQGPTRVILLYTLEKSKDPRAQATIDELANEPDLREEIKEIFKRREQRKKRKLRKMH